MAGILSGHIVLASATERLTLASTTKVATFTDTDFTDLLSGFTATIDWGDGSTSPGTITGSNGSFSVLGGHSYSDEGNFTLSATIVRASDNATITDTGNIAVAEHDVLAAQGTTLLGNPGSLLNNVTVATFTDTDTAAVAGDFQAIVDWGDGTATTTGTITGSNGSFAVHDSHIYASAGQDTITVTLVDTAPGSANTVAIGTANIGLAAQVSLTSATEKVATAPGTVVASITDGNLADLAGGFTAVIDWGDGTTSPGTVVGSNGSFSILGGGHTYADEGDFTLTTTLTRTSDNTVVTSIGDVAVIEHDVLAAQGKTISGNPGQVLNNVTVATFTDTDTAALASDFLATIDWGDGTISAGTITGSNGSFAVIGGGHAYANAGQDTITVTVTDPAPGTAIVNATGTATIGLIGQEVLNSATERVALAPGTVVASFLDGNLADLPGGFTAIINWGDGTTSAGSIVGSNGAFSIEGGHSYADEGSFTVTATTRISDNASVTSSGPVAVAEHDVLAGQGTTLTAVSGQPLANATVATFTDTDTAALASDFLATIDWGDGTTSAGTIAGSNGLFAVSGTHTYATTGQDTITVTMTDPAPGTAIATANSFRFDHVNQPPVNTVPGPLNTFAHVALEITGLSVADPDATTLTATLHVDHGTLTLASVGGAAVSGSGTGTVTLVGSVAQIDATLGAAHNFVYVAQTGFGGTDTLTMISNDGGSSGSGGPKTDTDTVAIHVVSGAGGYAGLPVPSAESPLLHTSDFHLL
ncbi:beta strand repeat-containing protein [Bradyrhizobium sp. AZCC 2289]|uniref:beta strand repeat-containing protein n=1 Tax=Bradyrhizobium sp. AZCC 2289 TaxID=3117026 RepID=UPI002FF20C31